LGASPEDAKRSAPQDGICRPPLFMDRLLPRTALTAAFSSLTQPVVLVLGPPGAGKTATLSMAHAHFLALGASVRWLTLNSEDNDLPTLLSHLRLVQPAPHATAANRNEEEAGRFFIFLDGLERLNNPAAREQVQRFVLNLPMGGRVFLTEHRLRGAVFHDGWLRGMVHCLEPASLRFDDDEAFALLGETWTRQDARHLNELVDGWAAGLRFLARNPDASNRLLADVTDAAALPKAMSAYFEDVVCAAMQPETLAALMDLSALERCSPALLASMPSPGISWMHVEGFIRDGVFMNYLDEACEWAGFHPAFGRYLRQKLRHLNHDRFQELKRFAARWFVEHGNAAVAVRHAVGIADKPYAAQIVEQAGAIAVDVAEGPVVTLDVDISPERAGELPLLFLGQIYNRLRHGRHMQARAAFEAALSQTKGFTRLGNQADLTVVAAWRDIIQMMFCSIDDTPATEALIERQEAQLRALLDTDPVLAASIASVLAFAYVDRSQFAEAARVSAIGFQAHKDDNTGKGTLFLDIHHASNLISTGSLDRALHYVEHAQKLARADRSDDSYEVLSAQVMRGILHYERNELADARDCLLPALAKVRSINGWMWLYAEGFGAAAATLGLLDGLEAAQAQIRSAEEFAHERGLLRLSRLMAIAGITERVRAGDIRGAAEQVQSPLLAELLAVDAGLLHSKSEQIRALLASAQLGIELGRPRDALSLLYRADALLLGSADERLRFGYHALTMRCDFVLRRYNSAFEQMQAAVTIARNSGLVRRILDHRPFILDVSDWASRSERKLPPHIADYIDEVLRTRDASASRAQTGAGRQARPVEPLVGAFTLSRRESEIITLVAEGLSAKEIARRLDIAEGTVKSHRKKIHEKLGASTRSQAILRARELLII
jgi:LuxR family maltose regulon positive regulatory protein